MHKIGRAHYPKCNHFPKCNYFHKVDSAAEHVVLNCPALKIRRAIRQIHALSTSGRALWRWWVSSGKPPWLSGPNNIKQAEFQWVGGRTAATTINFASHTSRHLKQGVFYAGNPWKLCKWMELFEKVWNYWKLGFFWWIIRNLLSHTVVSKICWYRFPH